MKHVDVLYEVAVPVDLSCRMVVKVKAMNISDIFFLFFNDNNETKGHGLTMK